MRSSSDPEVELAKAIIYGGALLVLLCIAVLHFCDHAAKISSGEWQDLSIYICSGNVDPTLLQTWPAIRTWIEESHISLKPGREGQKCVHLDVTVATADLHNGNLDQVRVEWTVKKHKSSSDVWPEVYFDDVPSIGWNLLARCTWTISGNEYVGQTQSVRIKGPELLAR